MTSSEITGAEGTTPGRNTILELDETPARMIVVSDLHLASGLDPQTGRYSRLENFFCDVAFQDFLGSETPVDEAGHTLLVLNGDTFDLVRVVRYPVRPSELVAWGKELEGLGLTGDLIDPEQLRKKIVRRERRFGLRTDDFKAVWKLRLFAEGHKTFFDALRGWISDGGRVLFVKGNHDLELHWPLVQTWLRREIAPNHPDRVSFCEEAFHAKNVYVEHGHRLDPVNCVVGAAELSGNRGLRLPIGSFFNRYVVNRLEGIEPFLDNMKPYLDLAFSLVRRHPLRSGRILWHGAWLVIRSLKVRLSVSVVRWWIFFFFLAIQMVSVVVIISALLAPPVGSLAREILPSGFMRVAVSAMGLSAPWLVGMISEIIASFGRRAYKNKLWEDRYGKGVYQVLSTVTGSYRRVYGVLGHTHEPDTQYFGHLGGPEAFYLNSGTWTPSWPKGRPDLWGRTTLSFVRFTLDGGEYVHEHREWAHEQTGQVPSRILMRNLWTPSMTRARLLE